MNRKPFISGKISRHEIKLNNVSVNTHVVMYTDNCNLEIKQGDTCISISEGMFVLIERGVTFSCHIRKKKTLAKPFSVIKMDRSLVIKLKNVMISLYKHVIDDSVKREFENKIISVKGKSELLGVYNAIQNIEDDDLKALKIAYFVSMLECKASVINSLYSSLITTFSDKIRKLIEKEPERQWRISCIAEEFNIAEISVRKRLISENISFNQILLEVRMRKAMNFLLDNEYQINQIAKKVGISTPSYFIRKFKEHFGVTPKQFLLYFRGGQKK